MANLSCLKLTNLSFGLWTNYLDFQPLCLRLANLSCFKIWETYLVWNWPTYLVWGWQTYHLKLTNLSCLKLAILSCLKLANLSRYSHMSSFIVTIYFTNSFRRINMNEMKMIQKKKILQLIENIRHKLGIGCDFKHHISLYSKLSLTFSSPITHSVCCVMKNWKSNSLVTNWCIYWILLLLTSWGWAGPSSGQATLCKLMKVNIIFC